MRIFKLCKATTIAFSALIGNSEAYDLGAAFPNVTNGDFASPIVVTNSPNTGWLKNVNENHNPDNHSLSDVSIADGQADLFQQYGPDLKPEEERWANLSYQFSTNSPTQSAWKISSRLKWQRTGDHEKDAIKSFSLNLNSISLFSISVTGSEKLDSPYKTSVLWKTPTQSGSIDEQKMGINSDSYSDISIEYDPVSGFVKFILNGASIFQGTTTENISINTIQFGNSAPKWSPGHLYVDNAKAEYVTSTSMILHGIPNGSFNNGAFASSVPGGTWSTYANWSPSAQVLCSVGSVDPSNGFIQLINNWYPHTAQVTYTDSKTTNQFIPWSISVDLKGKYTRHLRDDIVSLFDALGNKVFSMAFKGSKNVTNGTHSSISWLAGGASGSLIDAAEIDTTFYKTVSIEYNPISGQATGRIANSTIFSIFTTKGLIVKSLSIENSTDNATWDAGVLYVDNIKSKIIPDISSIGVLHGIEKGDFADLPSTGTGTVTYGWWQSYSTQTGNASWDNMAKVSLQGAGASKHVELWQNWKDHSATITYNDYNNTPSQQTWKVSADVKGVYSSTAQPSRKDAMKFLDKSGHTIFSIGFNGTKVYWDYFDEHDFHSVQSELISSVGLSSSSYSNFALQYNPTSGEVFAYRDGKQIYTTIVDLNILISAISFSNTVDVNTYDPGTFYVDNVKTTIEQNRDIRFRGIASKFIDYTTLAAIKAYGANQVRYCIAPTYAVQSSYDSTTNPFGFNQPGGLNYNSFPFWNDAISQLNQGLENARKLGLAVVVNVHQVPQDDIEHPKQIWADNNESEKFKLCWRQIADRTQHTDQAIWLELYNEPNVDANNDVAQTQWNTLAQQTIDQIRGQNIPAGSTNYGNAYVDRKHPIVFYAGPGSLDWGYRFAPLMFDNYFPVIYSLHQWQNDIYPLYGTDKASRAVKAGWFPDRPVKGEIRNFMKQSKIFQEFYGVKLWVGEFGVSSSSKERDQWIIDHIDLFEEYGWDWQFWSWDGTFFPEKDSTSSLVGSKMLNAFKLNR